MSKKLRAPFPWVGGKSRQAELMLKYLDHEDSRCKRYIEPFAGSIATLLKREQVDAELETVNDLDGLIINAWRAIVADPQALAKKCLERPVSEVDLMASDFRLRAQRERLTNKLRADLDYYETDLAASWLVYQAYWIGSGFTSVTGPWVVEDGGVVSKKSEGTKAQVPVAVHQGVRACTRMQPPSGSTHKGVRACTRAQPPVGVAHSGVRARSEEGLLKWFTELQDRLLRVRFVQGDWRRILTTSYLKGTNTPPKQPSAVLLDPPYDAQSQKGMTYEYFSAKKDAQDEESVSTGVRRWCLENGSQEWLRIVLCGRAKEHDELLQHGWEKIHVNKTAPGFKRAGKDGKIAEVNTRRKEEYIWVNPAAIECGLL